MSKREEIDTLTRRLEYLRDRIRELERVVGVIPRVDYGYDISGYTKIETCDKCGQVKRGTPDAK